MRYAHFVEMCEKCANNRSMQQLRAYSQPTRQLNLRHGTKKTQKVEKKKLKIKTDIFSPRSPQAQFNKVISFSTLAVYNLSHNIPDTLRYAILMTDARRVKRLTLHSNNKKQSQRKRPRKILRVSWTAVKTNDRVLVVSGVNWMSTCCNSVQSSLCGENGAEGIKSRTWVQAGVCVPI